MKLEDASDEELTAELERRKRGTRPKPLPHPDFSGLVSMLEAELNEAEKSGHWNEDAQHFIYERVMEIVYGKDFWDWRGKQDW